MIRTKFIIILCLLLFCVPDILASEPSGPESSYLYTDDQDTTDKQMLYNGRAWRNLYSKVIGDQFLFTKEFMTGTVTIDGKVFRNLPIKYDIFNDQILTITDRGIIIQLNKEMVSKFSVGYKNTVYKFARMDPDSVNALSGYVDILYDGNVSLYVKHRKEILFLAVDHKSDLFEESHRVYLEKDGKIFLISSKSDLLNTLIDNKKQVRSFIRSKKLMVTKRNPWSLVPVIEYYNSLAH